MTKYRKSPNRVKITRTIYRDGVIISSPPKPSEFKPESKRMSMAEAKVRALLVEEMTTVPKTRYYIELYRKLHQEKGWNYVVFMPKRSQKRLVIKRVS